MKPNPPTPVTVSQATSLAVLGVDGRRFRELVHARSIPHGRVGKLVVARVSDVLEALGLDEKPAPANETEPDDAPRPNRVLASIGRYAAR
jgi:hypothetical protein